MSAEQRRRETADRVLSTYGWIEPAIGPMMREAGLTRTEAEVELKRSSNRLRRFHGDPIRYPEVEA